MLAASDWKFSGVAGDDFKAGSKDAENIARDHAAVEQMHRPHPRLRVNPWWWNTIAQLQGNPPELLGHAVGANADCLMFIQ